MEKKILVLGGTGAMGVYLIPELLKKNYKVFVTSRKKKKSKNTNLIYLQGDAHDSEFLKSCLLNKWDAIIDFMVYNTPEFQGRVNELLNNTNHYIFLSTYRVFADSETPINEESPRLIDVCTDKKYLETDEYALTKARQENILRESSQKNWTILRPSITYSKNRFQLATLEADLVMNRAKLGLPVAVAKDILDKKTTMTWAGDVGVMIANLVNNNKAYSEDFNVVTSENKTWREIAEIYQKHTSMNLVEVNLHNYLQIIDNPYQVRYDRLYNRVMDNSKILNILNLPKYELKSLNEGLSSEIVEVIKNDSLFSINYGLQARMDKITNSKIPLDKVNLKNRIKYYFNYLKTKKVEIKNE